MDALINLILWQSFYTVHVYEIIVLYTLNVYNFLVNYISKKLKKTETNLGHYNLKGELHIVSSMRQSQKIIAGISENWKTQRLIHT